MFSNNFFFFTSLLYNTTINPLNILHNSAIFPPSLKIPHHPFKHTIFFIHYSSLFAHFLIHMKIIKKILSKHSKKTCNVSLGSIIIVRV